ncbi:WxL domain-containing protein [Vagococcus sp. BWB3-3]|uniref:WxL domain-containing protein n=1 Tax=Vagococcus allomyrinae TaxID=2794353 RepID=A0A940PD45_9ENTE|nr:WxL domain-containing protein [Vagococcus allomyrinae]MBP1042610.1 WxL domain-containing protein [Vagococcus allomyrinae]
MLNKKMSLKKVVIAGLVATTVLAAGGASVLAAQETIGNKEDGSKATSYGHVTLTEGDEKELPEVIVPEEDKDKEKPDPETLPTENEGVLTIDAISALEFGTLTLSGKSEEYSVTNAAGFTNKKVQVTDRRGTGAGWNLKVKASAFADKDEPTKVLKGASISFPQGEVISSEGNLSVAPSVFASTIIVPNTDAQSFMSATAGTGLGSWMNVMESKDVKLKIPAGNLKGDYSATLEWSLESLPTP